MSLINVSHKLFKVVSDETRLKILMILNKSEFTVGELVGVLGIHQSNASRHLSQLRDLELVDDRREGSLIYYRWSDALRAETELVELLKRAWKELADASTISHKIEQVITQRKLHSKDFFEQVAGKYRKLARPGGGAEALLKAFSYLLDFEVCADLGAGEGELSLILSASSKRVIAVDLNQKMLDIIQDRARSANIDNIETRQGDLEAIPISDASVDLVVVSQVLHHLPTPETIFGELRRILKPKGKVLIIDLMSHDQEWVRNQLGDLWLGFDQGRVESWMEDNGLKIRHEEAVIIEDGLPVFMLIGEKA